MKIRRYDIAAILLSLLIFSGFTWYGWNRSGDSGYLYIEDRDGIALYPLSEDREVHVRGPVGESVIQITEGKAAFIHSDCDDNLCVHMGQISESGEWAACLPNEVFLYIDGGETQEVDADVY